MKNIIFFSKNLKIGGMEKALVNLLNSLCDKYRITLVLEEKAGALLGELDSKIVVKEYRLSKSKNIIFRKTYNFLKRVIWAIRYKNHFSFACNYATYSVIGSKLAQIASKNSAYYVHSDYYNMYHGKKEEIDSFFGPHELNKFRSIIFVSNESMEKMLRIYPEYRDNSFVINNLISYNDIISLSNEKTDFEMGQDSINLLFVGRLENESKNFDLLLESFKLVVSRAQDSRYKLYIIGDGTYRNNIINKVNQYDLESCVFLLGEKENPYPYIKMCDSIIFTSNYEGFPVTYLEALVLNKKIFTTVIMSDESLNMENYAVRLENKPERIAEAILKNMSKSLDETYQIDFRLLNQKKIEMIEDLIEV